VRHLGDEVVTAVSEALASVWWLLTDRPPADPGGPDNMRAAQEKDRAAIATTERLLDRLHELSE
jgi:hypothetical protein